MRNVSDGELLGMIVGTAVLNEDERGTLNDPPPVGYEERVRQQRLAARELERREIARTVEER